MENIKDVLMRRDGLTGTQADKLITEAQLQFDSYLAEGEEEMAYNICQEFFGLEPDYLVEFF